MHVSSTVIADTLEASYSGSPSQSLSEGDPLQLECQVFSQTFQHTHLSVTWFLHGEEDKTPRPIITLDKDLTVKPGAGFEDRYRAGLISMDKVEDTTYRLKMPQVQQSDQGKFYCKAIEWIQDPDRSWTQIAHKTTTACNVEIKPIGHFFSVTWLKNQQKVAQIGSSGVLTIFDSYKERENAAEMRAVKTSHTDYLLTIRSARTEDQGQYQCEVWQEDMNEDGTFKKIQKQMSSLETVSITAKESDLAVVMVMNDALTEGDPLRVTCVVSGFKGPLSVSWQHKKGVSFSDVISLTHEGVMKDIGARYQSRHVQTLHSPAGNFTLEIGASATSDSGEYKCTVSEWTVQSNGEMKKANTRSQQKAITVNSVEIKLHVQKENRTFNITDHQTEFTVDCIIDSQSSDKSAFEVTWFKVQEEEGPVTIFTARRDGTLHSAVSDKNLLFGRPRATHYKLTVPQINPTDMGQYYCQVEEWLVLANTWKKLASDKSGELSIYVHTEDAVTAVIYVENGKNMTLDPYIPGEPEEILWTFNGNKVAEYDSTGFQEYAKDKDSTPKMETNELSSAEAQDEDVNRSLTNHHNTKNNEEPNMSEGANKTEKTKEAERTAGNESDEDVNQPFKNKHDAEKNEKQYISEDVAKYEKNEADLMNDHESGEDLHNHEDDE
ncbi:immunoglobulin superfamily member 3-like protein [Labeo rohita]|nr:immunoglobulin superfamily member 3-like protein [Labeo rohita]